MQSKHHTAITSAYEAFRREITAHTKPGFHQNEAISQAKNAEFWALEGAKDQHLLDIKTEQEDNHG